MNSSEKAQFNFNDFFNKSLDEEQIDFRNLCSWLLIFSPSELSILTSILAIIISSQLTIEEQAVVASFFVAVSDNIFLISAQQLLIQSAKDLQNQVIERKKEEEEKAKEELEKEQKAKELNDLKNKIEKLEEQLNHHLKNSL
ncbi:MAG: hypothetical protein K0Q49_1675 [Haloplasmataceae bacterium]|jgi:flagellar motor protein MotB|nr:hypothetical protein [Haloplasmataceae bacterium]